MCSIHGIYSHVGCDDDDAELLHRLIIAGSERGSDSAGIVASNGRALPMIGSGKDYRLDDVRSVVTGARWAVANCRAEPTTEWVHHKRLDDVQPFSYDGVTVAHNGTVANDADIIALHALQAPTQVDSWALLPVLDSEPIWSAAGLCELLKENVVGSWALLAGRGDELAASVNYRPLAAQLTDDGIAFTSLARHGELGPGLVDRMTDPWTRLRPYSTVLVTPHGIDEAELRTNLSTRALVVASAGLDSTVVASMLLDEGWDVGLLHLTYGCRAEAREVAAVRDIAARLDVPLTILDLTAVFAAIGHSRLLDPTAAHAPGEAGAEFAHEWVPARNLVLLAVASALAEAHGYDAVALGANIEEAGAYPDNEQEFIERLGDVLPYATHVDRDVRILMPVGHMTKREIVAAGLDVDAPLDLTWSCYEGRELHCGTCGPCFMRRTAFAMSGVPDPIRYEGDS